MLIRLSPSVYVPLSSSTLLLLQRGVPMIQMFGFLILQSRRPQRQRDPLKWSDPCIMPADRQTAPQGELCVSSPTRQQNGMPRGLLSPVSTLVKG